jgi:hypothetical protein
MWTRSALGFADLQREGPVPRHTLKGKASHSQRFLITTDNAVQGVEAAERGNTQRDWMKCPAPRADGNLVAHRYVGTETPMIRNEAEVTTAVATSAPLTAADRCDRCGAQAYLRVELQSGGELLFCAHHAREHGDKLKEIAVNVVDETHKLGSTQSSAGSSAGGGDA